MASRKYFNENFICILLVLEHALPNLRSKTVISRGHKCYFQLYFYCSFIILRLLQQIIGPSPSVSPLGSSSVLYRLPQPFLTIWRGISAISLEDSVVRDGVMTVVQRTPKSPTSSTRNLSLFPVSSASSLTMQPCFSLSIKPSVLMSLNQACSGYILLIYARKLLSQTSLCCLKNKSSPISLRCDFSCSPHCQIVIEKRYCIFQYKKKWREKKKLPAL